MLPRNCTGDLCWCISRNAVFLPHSALGGFWFAIVRCMLTWASSSRNLAINYGLAGMAARFRLGSTDPPGLPRGGRHDDSREPAGSITAATLPLIHNDEDAPRARKPRLVDQERSVWGQTGDFKSATKPDPRPLASLRTNRMEPLLILQRRRAQANPQKVLSMIRMLQVDSQICQSPIEVAVSCSSGLGPQRLQS